MKLFDWLLGVAPEPEPEPESPPLPRPNPRKTQFHIARFERALEQCTNEARRPELEKWLAYYRALAEVE